MIGIPRTAPASNQPLSRDLLLTLLDTALRTDELKYARRLCTAWLAIYPGDLPVSLLFARSYLQEKSIELRKHALPILEEICTLDPEYAEAQELLAEARKHAGASNHTIAKACADALTSEKEIKPGKNLSGISWAKSVHEARTALENVRSGDYQQIEKAEYYIHKALVENPDTPLASVIHLRLIESKSAMPKSAIRSLAEIYHDRWPECLQFSLTLSNELMEAGESGLAVSMLHQAVSKDVSGQVARRMWGDHHQYASLWPTSLEAINTGPNSPQNIPIPAAVASSLGWNQIGAGPGNTGFTSSANVNSTTVTEARMFDARDIKVGFVAQKITNASEPTPLSDEARSVQTELERMADELKRPHLAREDGRFPIYVIFSTRGGLEGHYGSPAFQAINEELKKLTRVIHGYKINKEFWGSLLLYADDPASLQPYGLKPVPYDDPWQLKVTLSELDAALEKRGERIGAVLIVGGPEIVPYHNLPNPVEDADANVPSDNPYSARDGNYFISDWAVGRVSGGSDNDSSHLLGMLKEITNRYDPKAIRFSWYHRLLEYFQELMRRGVSKKLSSYGYTAAVWRRASLSVFRSIGEADDLLVSPPTHTCINPDMVEQIEPVQVKNTNTDTCLFLPLARLGYFNLHGVPDGGEWYGQCDPTLPEAGPDFPVAMRPGDIRNGGSAPKLVFTEACYGANITGKSIEDAISLKFLASGTQAVIGSTCISYGSLTTPLTSADLLGRVFWSLLQEGFTAGESLRRAKIHLTREMHRRQGFLDAEDQKTLISFVLFGDPLAQPFTTKVSPKLVPHLSDSTVPVPTVCEQTCENEPENPIPLETISHLKSVVEQYLPDMDDAKISFSRERQSCAYFCNHYWTGKQCMNSAAEGKNKPAVKYHRRVVTLSKNIEQAQHIHRQYARLTLDDSGKIVKMVVSH